MNNDNPRFTLDHLQGNENNPRIMDAPDQKNLTMSIQTYGDLSGVVWNKRTGKLVGGHQRVNDFKKSKNPRIEYIARYDAPNSVGTVARGLVWLEGFDEPFNYREVDWPAEFADRANVAANRIQGRFDSKKLRDLVKTMDPDLVHTTGLLEDEVDALLAEELATDQDQDEEAGDHPPRAGDKLMLDCTPEQREAIDAAIYKRKTELGQTTDSATALFFICQEYLNGGAL